jgi:hypothetical protein
MIEKTLRISCAAWRLLRSHGVAAKQRSSLATTPAFLRKPQGLKMNTSKDCGIMYNSWTIMKGPSHLNFSLSSRVLNKDMNDWAFLLEGLEFIGGNHSR